MGGRGVDDKRWDREGPPPPASEESHQSTLVGGKFRYFIVFGEHFSYPFQLFLKLVNKCNFGHW